MEWPNTDSATIRKRAKALWQILDQAQLGSKITRLHTGESAKLGNALFSPERTWHLRLCFAEQQADSVCDNEHSLRRRFVRTYFVEVSLLQAPQRLQSGFVHGIHLWSDANQQDSTMPQMLLAEYWGQKMKQEISVSVPSNLWELWICCLLLLL